MAASATGLRRVGDWFLDDLPGLVIPFPFPHTPVAGPEGTVESGRAWIHLQGLERGRHIAIPLKRLHLPFGTLRILLQDNG